jgi:hypothetical protein
VPGEERSSFAQPSILTRKREQRMIATLSFVIDISHPGDVSHEVG